MLWIESGKEVKMDLLLIREDIWENIARRVNSENQEKFL